VSVAILGLAIAVYIAVPPAPRPVVVERREPVDGTLILRVHEPADDRAIRDVARREGSDVRVLVYAQGASIQSAEPVAAYVWNGALLIREF